MHLQGRLLVPVDTDPADRAAARGGAGDGVATGSADARADARTAPACWMSAALVGLVGLGALCWWSRISDACRVLAVWGGVVAGDRRGDPSSIGGRAAAGHRRVVVDRDTVVRLVPVPLADLPGDARGVGAAVVGRRVRASRWRSRRSSPRSRSGIIETPIRARHASGGRGGGCSGCGRSTCGGRSPASAPWRWSSSLSPAPAWPPPRSGRTRSRSPSRRPADPSAIPFAAAAPIAASRGAAPRRRDRRRRPRRPDHHDDDRRGSRRADRSPLYPDDDDGAADDHDDRPRRRLRRRRRMTRAWRRRSSGTRSVTP